MKRCDNNFLQKHEGVVGGRGWEVLILVVVLIFVFLNVNFVSATCDNSTYSGSGNWTINSTNSPNVCSDMTITLNGNLTIQEGGNLTFNRVTLKMNSSAAGVQNVYVENNATFIFNKSSLSYLTTASYKYIVGNPNSTIQYIDSYFGSYILQSIYANDYLYIQNTTFGKLSGYSAISSSLPCFSIYTNTTQYISVLINHSNLFQKICFYSDISGGNAHLMLLDTDYIPNTVFYSNTENCSVIINNTLDLKVLDDDLNTVPSIAVNITDELTMSIYNGTTDLDGKINSISLTHRIFNNSGNFFKNYTVSANGKSFVFEMGLPRREYSNRTLVIGTYNQNYDEKLSRVPYLYDFGFTMTDDTDTYDYRSGTAIYEGFYNLGFLTTVSTWALSGFYGSIIGFADNELQRIWLLDLKSKGFGLALHSASGGSDIRATTINAINNWSEYFGFPINYIEHSGNTELLLLGTGAVPTSDYYFLDLVNTSNVSYYWIGDNNAYTDNGKYRTTSEGSSSWYNGWKAYEESIDPITGERWSNGEISLFPNETNLKALVPNINSGATPVNLTSMIGKLYLRDNAQVTTNGLIPLYTPPHIFDLVETKDLTIVYTHSYSFSHYNATLTEIARYDGYFVPAGILLNYSSKLERVSIVGGDKNFTVTNNGIYSIEGVVVYPDTNGTIINISYANTTAGNYLLSIGLDKDEMMLPPLSVGESLTVNYDIMGVYDSTIPKVSNISNSHVELRNAIYNSTAKKTEFKVGLDRITTYNSTNSTSRSTNITIENLDSSKTYTILRDNSAWTNYSWSGNTLYIWTFLSEHNFTIQEKQSDTSSCSYAESCLGGYCVHGYCRSASIYCGDGYCDSGEICSSCSADCGVCPTSSSSGYPTYKPTQEQLKQGYEKLLGKNWKVQFTINEETHTAIVNFVDTKNKKVEIELEEVGELIELDEGEIKKFDLNDDGYYDLQISVNEVRVNGYADLEFKEIHEEVPAEEKEEQESSSKKEVIKSWMWITGGIVLLVVIGIVIRRLLKNKR